MSGTQEALDYLFTEALDAIRQIGDAPLLSDREKVRQMCLVLHRLKKDRDKVMEKEALDGAI